MISKLGYKNLKVFLYNNQKNMFTSKNSKILFGIGTVVVVAIVVFLLFNFKIIKISPTEIPEEIQIETPINGMIMLIEFEKIEGILQWEKELDARNLTALLKVQDNVLEEYPEVFKRLANKGYEVAGGYDEAPFWDMSYEEQHKFLQDSKELVERITGKKMRVFGSRYFAYDENTLKAANDLGIEYILGRGVNDVEAVIYQPEEYAVKVISVSNVDVGEMGRGSLCDYSLWARGSNAQEFAEMLDISIAKNPENMILVSHAYLGGTRLEWWNEYERALLSQKVIWTSFDTWIANQEIVTLPNAEIPINNEVKYVAPSPEKPIEDYAAIPGIEFMDDEVCATTGDEMMCQ